MLASATASNSKILLESCDGKHIVVTPKVVLQSIVCADMLNAMEAVKGDIKIPVARVDISTLEKVVGFCQHYEDYPEYVPPTIEEPSVSLPAKDSWDMQFLDVSPEDLQKIILAANFLNIPRLIDACCFRLAHAIQGKSVEEVRSILDIENDFSPEEEERMRREHAWYQANTTERENN